MIMAYRDALDDCDSAIAIEPTNSKSYFRKATALKGLGRLDDCVLAFDNGLVHDPTSATATKDRDTLVNARDQTLPELRDLCNVKNFRDVLVKVNRVIELIGSTFREFNIVKVEALLELFKTEDAYNLTNSMVSPIAG